MAYIQPTRCLPCRKKAAENFGPVSLCFRHLRSGPAPGAASGPCTGGRHGFFKTWDNATFICRDGQRKERDRNHDPSSHGEPRGPNATSLFPQPQPWQNLLVYRQSSYLKFVFDQLYTTLHPKIYEVSSSCTISGISQSFQIPMAKHILQRTLPRLSSFFPQLWIESSTVHIQENFTFSPKVHLHLLSLCSRQSTSVEPKLQAPSRTCKEN